MLKYEYIRIQYEYKTKKFWRGGAPDRGWSSLGGPPSADSNTGTPTLKYENTTQKYKHTTLKHENTTQKYEYTTCKYEYTTLKYEEGRGA